MKDPERFLNTVVSVYLAVRPGAHADALDLMYQCVDEALIAGHFSWVDQVLARATEHPTLPEAVRQSLLTIVRPYRADFDLRLQALRTRTDTVPAQRGAHPADEHPIGITFRLRGYLGGSGTAMPSRSQGVIGHALQDADYADVLVLYDLLRDAANEIDKLNGESATLHFDAKR